MNIQVPIKDTVATSEVVYDEAAPVSIGSEAIASVTPPMDAAPSINPQALKSDGVGCHAGKAEMLNAAKAAG